jgi:hypothetical protein
MTNKEAREAWKKLYSEIDKDNWLFVGTINPEMVALAIKALKHESYLEDVKQALNDWLSNISSPQTALNDIYRAYMRTEAENEI